MPSHTHNILSGYGDIGSPTMTTDAFRYQFWGGSNRGWHSFLISDTGENTAHNNLSPYVSIYIFKRIN